MDLRRLKHMVADVSEALSSSKDVFLQELKGNRCVPMQVSHALFINDTRPREMSSYKPSPITN
jgi:hypothetical protein